MPKKIIAVVDGLGGGIGVELVSRLKELAKEGGAELIALGSNAVAVERMVKAGAARGATGVNAVKHSVRKADFILGPIGIIIADSMMGEITNDMTLAILDSPAERILLPLQNEHLTLAGFEALPLSKMIDRACEIMKERLGIKQEGASDTHPHTSGARAGASDTHPHAYAARTGASGGQR